MPGNVGPSGPGIWYPGDGGGVGSAVAVPAAATTTAATAPAARTMFLAVFIASFLVSNPVGECPGRGRQRVPAVAGTFCILREVWGYLPIVYSSLLTGKQRELASIVGIAGRGDPLRRKG